MDVSADQNRCVASGLCASLAPEVFDLRDDDGKVVVVDAHPSQHLHSAVREAEQSCPSLAIVVHEDNS
jgi:ferredoxin